jgi:hypothetical protein
MKVKVMDVGRDIMLVVVARLWATFLILKKSERERSP